MGKIKFSDGLFIGTQELKEFQNNSLMFKTILGYLTKNYGFVELKDEIFSSEDSNCWNINVGASGTFTISSPSYAFAYPNNLIAWTNPYKQISVPNSLRGKSFWVKIKYAEDNFEKGILSVDNLGNVRGNNTVFTEKLRGEPNFASVIELFSFDSNSELWISTGQQYKVESVKTDTSIVISSVNGLPNTNISYIYKVVGTFPVGMFVSEKEKYPFVYDSCEVELVEESAENTAPNEALMMKNNKEFYIGRMTYTEQGILTLDGDKKNYFNSDNFDKKYSKWWSLK